MFWLFCLWTFFPRCGIIQPSVTHTPTENRSHQPDRLQVSVEGQVKRESSENLERCRHCERGAALSRSFCTTGRRAGKGEPARNQVRRPACKFSFAERNEMKCQICGPQIYLSQKQTRLLSKKRMLFLTLLKSKRHFRKREETGFWKQSKGAFL